CFITSHAVHVSRFTCRNSRKGGAPVDPHSSHRHRPAASRIETQFFFYDTKSGQTGTIASSSAISSFNFGLQKTLRSQPNLPAVATPASLSFLCHFPSVLHSSVQTLDPSRLPNRIHSHQPGNEASYSTTSIRPIA